MKFTVDIPNETGELITGITKFIRSIKDALEDGWQPGIDIPMIMLSAISDLPQAIEGYDKIPEEARNHPDAMIAAGGIMAAEIYKALAGK